MTTEECIDSLDSSILRDLPENIELANGITIGLAYSDNSAVAWTANLNEYYLLSRRMRRGKRVICKLAGKDFAELVRLGVYAPPPTAGFWP